jgi:hypothetical protein
VLGDKLSIFTSTFRVPRCYTDAFSIDTGPSPTELDRRNARLWGRMITQHRTVTSTDLAGRTDSILGWVLTAFWQSWRVVVLVARVMFVVVVVVVLLLRWLSHRHGRYVVVVVVVVVVFVVVGVVVAVVFVLLFVGAVVVVVVLVSGVVVRFVHYPRPWLRVVGVVVVVILLVEIMLANMHCDILHKLANMLVARRWSVS